MAASIRNAPPSSRFLEVAEIRNGVVILKNGGLRTVLMTTSVNFALKSAIEQESLVFRYQSFLNSLDFPLQIVVNSRQLNLDDYLLSLEERAQNQENELLKMQTREYMDFVQSLIELSNIISKYFYIVIPFSASENAKGLVGSLGGGLRYSQGQFEELKNQLWQRVKHVQIGLEAMQIRAEPLNTTELIELFYNLYNPADKMRQKKQNVMELAQSIGQGDFQGIAKEEMDAGVAAAQQAAAAQQEGELLAQKAKENAEGQFEAEQQEALQNNQPQ